MMCLRCGSACKRVGITELFEPADLQDGSGMDKVMRNLEALRHLASLRDAYVAYASRCGLLHVSTVEAVVWMSNAAASGVTRAPGDAALPPVHAPVRSPLLQVASGGPGTALLKRDLRPPMCTKCVIAGRLLRVVHFFHLLLPPSLNVRCCAARDS